MRNLICFRVNLAVVVLLGSFVGITPTPTLRAWQAGEAGQKTGEASQTEEVVAEGKGASAKEALEDAFRSAVRQVVGAVVEAKTLVENDELIEDKVLTYSGAFITKYEEVPGSSKVKDGLHSVKITAQVERKTVIAKLQSANVTVKEVDGKSMFAELTTKVEAEKGAAAIIEEKLKGFPENCVTAFVSQDKPKLIKNDEEEATYEFRIKVSVDYEAFRAFSKDLSATLSKMAAEPIVKRPATFIKQADGYGEVYFWMSHEVRDGLNEYVMSRLRLKSSDEELNHSLLLLADSASTSRDSIDYQFVWLDNPVTPALFQIGRKKCQLRLELLSKDKEPVKVIEIIPENRGYGVNVGNLLAPGRSDSWPSKKNSFKGFSLFWLSPVFHRDATLNSVKHVPQLQVPVQVTMPNQDWLRTTEFKVELKFVE